jgi:hypothetical protein
MVVFAYSKKKVWLFATLSLVLLFQISMLLEKKQVFNQHIIFVYNTKNLMIHLINGRNNYLITEGQDTISENDQNLVRRVQNHLKLNNPTIINKTTGKDIDSGKFIDSGEIMMCEHEIQFLNCRIKFDIQSNYPTERSDIFTLTVHNPNHSKKQIQNTTIATGNPYFKEKQAFSIDYKTRLHGAYFQSLN